MKKKNFFVLIFILILVVSLLFDFYEGKKRNYIQTIACDKEKVKMEINSRNGMAGRLFIPSLGINVAIYEAEIYGGSSQEIVDSKDSAAIMFCDGITIIADHNWQGFYSIKNSVPDQTIAYINDGENVILYVCTDINTGINTREDLLDHEGNSVFEQEEGTLCMYTCRWNDKNVFYSYWKRL